MGPMGPLGMSNIDSSLLWALSGRFWTQSAQYQDLDSEANFLVCQVSNTRFHWFPVSHISRNLIWTQHVDRLGNESFWNRTLKIFPVMGSLSPKDAKNEIFFQRIATSGRHNSAMITDRRKFIIKITLCGMSRFQFTVGINSKSFPWPMHCVQETYHKSFCVVELEFTACHVILGEQKPFTQFLVILFDDLSFPYPDISNAAMTLITMLATIQVLFSERELTFTFAICYRPSVCRLSVVCRM